MASEEAQVDGNQFHLDGAQEAEASEVEATEVVVEEEDGQVRLDELIQQAS